MWIKVLDLFFRIHLETVQSNFQSNLGVLMISLYPELHNLHWQNWSTRPDFPSTHPPSARGLVLWIQQFNWFVFFKSLWNVKQGQELASGVVMAAEKDFVAGEQGGSFLGVRMAPVSLPLDRRIQVGMGICGCGRNIKSCKFCSYVFTL